MRSCSAGKVGRNMALAVVVVAAHGVALWAMQRTSVPPHISQNIAPVEVIAEFVAPPASALPAPALVSASPPSAPRPQPQPQRKPALQKAAQPKAMAGPAPSPWAPQSANSDATQEPAVPAPPPAAPSAPAVPPVPPAPAEPAAPVMEPPSSDAVYLNNPPPSYPAASRRMGEQGKVLLRVYIDAQGQPGKIEIKHSSGHDRLDQAALHTVRRWQFTPGKRNGVPEAMWHIVPVAFVLK